MRRDAEIGNEPRRIGHAVQGALAHRSGDRKLQAGVDRAADRAYGLFEGPFAADRVMKCGSRAVEADLERKLPAASALGETAQVLVAEEESVGQDDQITVVGDLSAASVGTP